MTAILEMRDISKSFPGVKALRDVNFSVEAGRDPRPRRRERRRQIDPDEGAQRRLPARHLRGRIFFDGEERRFRDINDSETLGIIIIHQELALIPLMSIAENIFLGNEPPQHRRHRSGRGLSTHAGAAGRSALRNRRIR